MAKQTKAVTKTKRSEANYPLASALATEMAGVVVANKNWSKEHFEDYFVGFMYRQVVEGHLVIGPKAGS
jgi:hypothetical protein